MISKKVVILGDSGVGKTSIFNRYFYDKFENQTLGSIGTSFKSTTIQIEGAVVRDMDKRVAKIQKQLKDSGGTMGYEDFKDSLNKDFENDNDSSNFSIANILDKEGEKGYEASSDEDKPSMVQAKGAVIKLTLWDTAGQEKFRSLTKQYLQDAQGAIIVYDSLYKPSFSSANKWCQDLKEVVKDQHLIIALASNKSDDLEGQQVHYEQGAELSDEIGAQIFKETSAKENIGITDLLQELGNHLYKVHRIQEALKKPEEKPDLLGTSHKLGRADSERMSQSQKPKKKCCK